MEINSSKDRIANVNPLVTNNSSKDRIRDFQPNIKILHSKSFKVEIETENQAKKYHLCTTKFQACILINSKISHGNNNHSFYNHLNFHRSRDDLL